MSETILVVEDDDALRRSEAVILRRFGFEVLEACDGQRALELFEANTVDAVVMDGKMPIVDGFEACGKIRASQKKHGATLPILMVTGMNESQAIEGAYRAGATDFILKPVNLTVLSYRLKHLIENSRLQNALSASRTTMETFVSAIPSAVIFCDENWTVTRINPAAEALFGWSADFFCGLPLQAVFVEQKQAQTVIKLMDANEKFSIADQIRFTNAREQPFWGEVLGAKLEKNRGKVLVISDATERRRAIEERERTAKMELVGLLAGGIAHDFNNILTAVFSSLSLVQMEVPPDSKAAGYLYGAQQPLEQARRLSQQLLSFSKCGAPVRRLCDVGRLLQQTVEFSLRGSKVVACLSIDENCPKAEVDEGQLIQVFSNLTVNAVQAMPKGGQLWVEMQSCTLGTDSPLALGAGGYLKICIKDEGHGIPAEIIDKVFDPYFTTKATGNGLGLATVLSVIKRHGGAITVDSAHGKGATFAIYLPLPKTSAKTQERETNPAVDSTDNYLAKVEFLPAATPAKKPPQNIFGGAAVPNLPGRSSTLPKKILLLEDQEIISSAVCALLERCGCEVVAFEDGQRAIDAYENAMREGKKFDLAILDMTLPGGLSGLETLCGLKAIDTDVRAVVSTGYADDPVMLEPEKHGFAGVLPKPYTFDALKELLEEMGRKPMSLIRS